MQPESIAVVDCDPRYKYSTIFHLEGLPPTCLLHGIDDEMPLFSRSVQLAEEMERHGLLYEFYAHEGLSRDSTSASGATGNW